MTGRTKRVAERILEELADMSERGEIKDPRVDFVTFTEVDLSRNLRHAKIYFSTLGDDKKIKDTTDGLNSAKGYIRSALAQKIRIKYMPEIEFIFDDTVRSSARISKLLHDIHEEEEKDQ